MQAMFLENFYFSCLLKESLHHSQSLQFVRLYSVPDYTMPVEFETDGISRHLRKWAPVYTMPAEFATDMESTALASRPHDAGRILC